jgi:hypothetical protein
MLGSSALSKTTSHFSTLLVSHSKPSSWEFPASFTTAIFLKPVSIVAMVLLSIKKMSENLEHQTRSTNISQSDDQAHQDDDLCMNFRVISVFPACPSPYST